MAKDESAKGLSSRILDVIREEAKSASRGRIRASDYYAKQGNPKDGGYAKSNYVKGDGFRMTKLDLVSRDVTIRARPAGGAKKPVVAKAAAKAAAKRTRGGGR